MFCSTSLAHILQLTNIEIHFKYSGLLFNYSLTVCPHPWPSHETDLC